MDRRLKVGVRELVEFCCRSGDLGLDGGPGVNAWQGVQTHQAIQRRYADKAEAEYRIKLDFTIDGLTLELGGRIDLLFDSEYPPRIEEIKTVFAHLPGLEEDTVHWGQLKVYGAIYAREKGLDSVVLSLNLVNLFNRQEQRHSQTFDRAELDAFVEEILRRYLHWHDKVITRQTRMRQASQSLEFPFTEFRPQQHRFAAEVYRGIRNQERLLIEAPTGSGKTISTLFPSVKAIGEDLCDQIVYLSAKVSGQQQAVDTVERMACGLAYLVIQAKARSCPCNREPEEIDADGRCLRCVGFFERLPAARERLLDIGSMNVAQVQAIATEFQLCPFELSLQMLPWADIVIGDFNYVFDPLVQLSYFKTDSKRKVLLIDELHNLVDRSRGMYSAKLSRAQIKQAKASPNSPEIEKALEMVQTALNQELRKQSADQATSTSPPESLLAASQQFSERLGFDIFANKNIAPEVVEFSKAIFRFQAIFLLFAKHHRALGTKPLEAREMKLLCLNAFEYLHDCYPLFTATIGFSATLTPMEYFRDALGMDSECRYLTLPPSFPDEHLQVCIADYVDTRYREREASIDAICESILRTCRVKQGNYLVFFASHYFMQQVHQRFTDLHPEIETLRQERDSDEAEQQAFLASFFDKEGTLGFAIMGGRFAEGIDYRGNALIGAIVVGVGLPQANHEQQLIQQDFDSMELDGFDYAFRFPGLIRVKQSAGRVIRDAQDRGVVVLLERRFCQSGYTRHLPCHWRPKICHNPESLEESLQAFWEAHDGAD